jgi:hypothetical protein
LNSKAPIPAMTTRVTITPVALSAHAIIVVRPTRRSPKVVHIPYAAGILIATSANVAARAFELGKPKRRPRVRTHSPKDRLDLARRTPKLGTSSP